MGTQQNNKLLLLVSELQMIKASLSIFLEKSSSQITNFYLDFLGKQNSVSLSKTGLAGIKGLGFKLFIILYNTVELNLATNL
jgi:hypothetical protein